MTAGEIVQALAPKVASLKLPPGYRIELGGEIERCRTSQSSIVAVHAACISGNPAAVYLAIQFVP